MIRQLLTALALLTGFAAAAEPVQAARVAQNIESVALAEQGGACIAGQGLGPGDRSPVAVPTGGGVCPRPVLTVPLPPIELKADRARE